MQQQKSKEYTWDEALQKMREGVKMCHRNFCNEWVVLVGNFTLVFEDGCECTIDEFKSVRHDLDDTWFCGWFEWR